MSQEAKKIVWDYWQAMNRGGRAAAAAAALHPEVAWHGFCPLRRLDGADAVWSRFWHPLLEAVPDLLRRPYLFLAGRFEGSEWVAGTGDLIGTFSRDWLLDGFVVPAAGRSVHVRFGEFCRVVDGKIVEIRLLIDLPDLLRQSGIQLLPPSYGRELWIPGPLAGDGLLRVEHDPAESARTLTLVEEMIFGGLNRYDGRDQASQGLERFWHPYMVWHGPHGLGSAYGLNEFKKNAQGPIVRAFPDRKGVGHRARLAEGCLAASTGWPSLAGTHQHEIFGWSPTGRSIGWNIMDFWKRENDRLLENWVLIDLVDAGRASGVDLLARLPESVGNR